MKYKELGLKDRKLEEKPAGRQAGITAISFWKNILF